MNWSKFFGDVEAFAPGILYAFNPALGLIASDVVGLVKTAQMSGLSGTEKAAAVVAGAGTIIATVNANAGKVLVDPALATTVLGGALAVIINTVKLVNNPSQIPAVTTALAPAASMPPAA